MPKKKEKSKKTLIKLLAKIKGFTLIELLIVVAIMGILAAAVIIAINPVERIAQARDAERIANLKQMQKAVEFYSVQFGSYPGETGVWYTNSGGNWWIRFPNSTSDQNDPRLVKFYNDMDKYLKNLPRTITLKKAVYIQASDGTCQSAATSAIIQYIKIDANHYKLSTRLESNCDKVENDGGTSTCCPIIGLSKGRSYEVYELYSPGSEASNPTY